MEAAFGYTVAGMAADLERIARRLRERVEGAVESELFTPEEQFYGPARLSYDQFRRAMCLKAELLREFQGARLEECYQTEVIRNEYGSCLKILHHVPLELPLGDPEGIRRELRSELRLLYGIGPAVEESLRALGYQTLEDLSRHPRWGEEARRLIRELQEGDLRKLQGLVHRWFPVSHPLGVKLFGLVPKERLRFFDLESLGLFGRPVVLLGLARPRDGGLQIQEYLARDILEELPAIIEIARELGTQPALVTYNGRAFDMNFLRERLSYYGLYMELEPVHLDLLPHARRRFRGLLPAVRLETVERCFGLERTIDLPSSLVPDFYNTYLETGNIGPLIPIIEHNKHDLIALGVLLVELSRSR